MFKCYGHIAPKTHWGKVVTILYAILGIPLMLLCLSNIGDVMAHSFRFIYWRVCCYMCTRKPKRVPSRRGRSMRSTIRSSGGRYSGRYRSYKHPGMRTSTRSADSALGLSETITRSSYSDTECRYNDTELNGLRQPRSQPTRYSEAVATTHAGDIMAPPITNVSPTSSKKESKQQTQMVPDYERPEMYDPFYLGTPVLFNKYAIDRNESSKGRTFEKFEHNPHTLPRRHYQKQQHHHHHHRSLENAPYQVPPSYEVHNKKNLEIEKPDRLSPPSHVHTNRRGHTSSSPGIMSPMGFAVARHNYKSPRTNKIREDVGSDARYEHYDFDDYDYDANSSSQAAKIKPVPIWLCVFLVVSYIFGGAFLFSEWENWHFLDSAYFCFITLTTIGFGDFVPAQRVQKNAEISIALCSLYLLFGIALLAMSFNLVQEEVINNVKAVAKRLGVIKEDDDDEDDV
ncbi:conserved hypothetical protein [Pediculus humanus corporis]|uniref:Potassium channel domain-containing protein n=1 Tax=Pediculus humanus subsp. corporis TaxID=121224 RepID=E0VY70_PEDHC|nr:uncharacterized protein Phum_PHUM509800 [Pediculus humanus corporis]EEB18326.1 conserved hypothetical protein [Pediculus humanus corporis]